ncbi:MAG TPA: YihY/virulence factor BrkB family protein [Steroidobacteraceae bacterium]|jgi:membrane protein|nr:YihY/virulence factor BrkB family protein [Steroidobacteraceae bacterium]
MIPTLWAAWYLIKDSVVEWNNDRASRKGAALAFYTVFSLAPILIVAIAIAGLFFGEEAARGEIYAQMSDLIGSQGAQAIQAMIHNASRPGAGAFATLVGVVTLFIGATTALAELKDGLDQIWEVPPERTSGFWYFVRKRLLSIGLILSIGFLLLVSLVFSAIVAAMAKRWGPEDPTGTLLQTANFVFAFILVTLLFAMIYKILPATRIAWRDVLIGSVVTAALFSIGKFAIGLYLGNSAITSSYGAAGSVILVLVWVYYSAQIFLLGAEFTKVYAHRYGSRRGLPTPHASSPAHEPVARMK